MTTTRINDTVAMVVLFGVIIVGFYMVLIFSDHQSQSSEVEIPEPQIIEVPVPVTTEAFDMRCTMVAEGYTVTRDTIAAGDLRYVVDRLVPLDTIP